MICRSGKSAATGSSRIGLDSPSRRPYPPGRPAPIPVWPVWKSATAPGVLDRGVQRVVLLVARIEALHGRVELEAPHPVLLDEAVRGIHRCRALQGVDRPERNEHVVVACGALGDVGARDRGVSEAGGRIDGEDDGGHSALAVVRRDAVELGTRAVGAEVFRGGFDQRGWERRLPVRVDLDVHVHIDRGQRVEVDRGFVAGHGRFTRAGAGGLPEGVGSSRRRTAAARRIRCRTTPRARRSSSRRRCRR